MLTDLTVPRGALTVEERGHRGECAVDRPADGLPLRPPRRAACRAGSRRPGGVPRVLGKRGRGDVAGQGGAVEGAPVVVGSVAGEGACVEDDRKQVADGQAVSLGTRGQPGGALARTRCLCFPG